MLVDQACRVGYRKAFRTSRNVIASLCKQIRKLFKESKVHSIATLYLQMTKLHI